MIKTQANISQHNQDNVGYKLINKFCLLLMIFGFFTTNLSSQTVNHIKLNYSFSYSLSDSYNSNTEITLTNNSDSSLLIRLKINEKLWKNLDDLRAYIELSKADSITNLENRINQAFRFVYNQTKHFPPLPNDEINKNPLLTINSIGSGVCNNRSLILVTILQNMGYDSRIVHLGGHSVAEVRSNNKWIMLDVTNGTIFYNSENMPLSVDEISKNENKSTIYYINNTRDLRELNSLLNIKSYVKLFETTQNNSIENILTSDNESENNTFTLPARSFINFDLNNNTSIENEIYSFCNINIASGTSDSIYIPFVIHHIEGNGEFKIDGSNILKFDSVYLCKPGKYYVKSNGLTVVTLINNKLLENIGTNNITFECDKNYKPELNYKSGIAINSRLNQSVQNKVSIERLKVYSSFFENNPDFISNYQFTNFNDLKKVAYKLNSEVCNYSKREINVSKKLNVLKKELKSKNLTEQDFLKAVSNPSFLKTIVVGLLEYNEQSFVQQIKSIYPEHEIHYNLPKK